MDTVDDNVQTNAQHFKYIATGNSALARLVELPDDCVHHSSASMAEPTCTSRHLLGHNSTIYTTHCHAPIGNATCAALSILHSTVYETNDTEDGDDLAAMQITNLYLALHYVQIVIVVGLIAIIYKQQREIRCMRRTPMHRGPRMPFGRPRSSDLPALKYLLEPLMNRPLQGGAFAVNSRRRQRGRFNVLYSPEADLNPHCLFASIL
eukprot:2040672-Amphidinium_carterae.1